MSIIQVIEQCRETQENIDKIYENLCTEIISEMDDRIPKYCFDNSKNRHKNKKPYWNDCLTELWNDIYAS